MAHRFRQKLTQGNVKRRVQHRIAILRRCLNRLVNRFLACSIGKPSRYRMLPSHTADLSTTVHPATTTNGTTTHQHHQHYPPYDQLDIMITKDDDPALDSDLVPLKITLLGDCKIGKTSFLEKYVGDEKQGGSNKKGLTQKDKTLVVSGARIAYCIWEVDGDIKYDQDHILLACKDSVAIMFMFDLTSRCTLNSVVNWYKESRKWNQTAIPVMIGTKFDDFIQLPIDIQWTIASEARAYAKALNATLFFSSSTYNINVNKVFKFITAKLFDLPWTVERNLNMGEPIIDF